MREYSLTAGPLSSFEYLYDPRRHERLREFPALALSPRTLADAKFSDYRRDPKLECAFFQALLPDLGGGRLFAGFADAGSGRGGRLGEALRKSPLVSAEMKYGVADDVVVLAEVADPAADLPRLWTHYPPSSGIVFFHLTTSIFDVVEVFWRRKAGDRKRTSDRLKHDALEFALSSRITILVDEEGAMHAVAHPSAAEGLEEKVQAAGRRAGLRITSAPGLFG